MASSEFDVVLRGGTLYDGSGGEPVVSDVAMTGDQIAAVGSDLGHGSEEVDVRGLAVAPGFINMLSWAAEPLIADPRSQSDIRQGVTLEVFGEGISLGPLNPTMKALLRERQTDVTYDVEWTTLDEGLRWLAGRGLACNVASFVGAATLRIHELDYADRPPSAEELERMRGLMDQAMRHGALGVGSSLIYAPALYADTDEMVALAEVAARHGGMYISHIRNEGNRLLEAIDELIEIARRSGAPAEIWHFKAAGQSNWPKLSVAIERVDSARRAGLEITADMYAYHASSTGLDATMPGWVQEGGHAAWVARLKEQAVRERLRQEISTSAAHGENEFVSAEKVLLVGFRNPHLRALTGKTLADVVALRGTSVEDTIMDLVVEDDSRVQSIFFTMSEDNVQRAMRLPWMSFCSDAGSVAPEGVFLNESTHPRAYGNFARILGHYVRDLHVLSLSEAIRKLTSFPAATLGIARRGRLARGFYGDVVAFDPERIQDHATFEQPHQYATGMEYVFVNGQKVLDRGEHTGLLPGQVVRRARTR